MIYDSHVSLYAVIGDPVEHSLSPTIHNTVLEYYKKNAVLLPVHVPAGQIGAFIASLPLYNIKGFAITMPHKSAILPYLATKDETVSIFGAANAVKVVDGKLHGYMFDGEGFARSLENEGVTIAGRNVLFLGAGDVTGSVALALAKRKAARITLLNRTPQKAERIASIIAQATGVPTSFGTSDSASLLEYAPLYDLIIQATPLGMHAVSGDYQDLRFISRFPQDAVVCDLIYNPAETKFLRYAREQGLATHNGLGMLLRQAELIQNVIMDIPTSEAAYAQALSAAKEKLYQTPRL